MPGPTEQSTPQISRYNRKTKTRDEMDCPNIIREYNAHMGGVNLMDGLLGRYHIHMRTTKWSNQIFYHLLDMAMVNAYLLYRHIHLGDEYVGKFELPEFRLEVVDAHCGIVSVPDARAKKAVGRPRKEYHFSSSSFKSNQKDVLAANERSGRSI